MPTPVLIPAHNEAYSVGSTLAALKDQDVRPIVIANGCDDHTAEVASLYTDEVIELDRPSKAYAIKAGLSWLGDRALDPVLMIDADSYPYSDQWAQLMTGALSRISASRPAVVGGPIARIDGPDLKSDIWHTAKPYWKQIRNHVRNRPILLHGANMLIALREEAILEKLMLLLPNYWPGEDQAIKDLVVEMGGAGLQAIHPKALVATDGSHILSITERLKYGKEYSKRKNAEHYAASAPPGARRYKPKAWLGAVRDDSKVRVKQLS